LRFFEKKIAEFLLKKCFSGQGNNFPFNKIHIQCIVSNTKSIAILLLPYILAGFEPGLSAHRANAKLFEISDPSDWNIQWDEK
jgi:hypothetical protein